jgi:hypothetical protein
MIQNCVLRRDLNMPCDPKHWVYPKGTLVSLPNKKGMGIRKISFDSPPQASLKESWWTVVPVYDYYFTRKQEKRYLKRIRYGNLLKKKTNVLKSLSALDKKMDEKLKRVRKEIV